MTDHLYRFRSIDALLGEYAELERQEIYFSPPEQLNDPMEGFKDVVWQGDAIVWRNLLRHYLLCLLHTTYLYCIMGPDFTQDSCTNFAYQTPDDLPDTAIRTLYGAICKDFFSSAAPHLLAETLGAGPLPLRRNGLAAYLRMLHPSALRSVLKAIVAQGLPVPAAMSGLDDIADPTQALAELVSCHAQRAPEAETMLAAGETISAQLALIHDFNSEIKNPPWLFVARDFPEFHINSLEKIIFPAWYTACFVANPTNAAMWGVYGDGHKGACLIFRTRANSDVSHGLDLRGIRSWSMSAGDTEMTPQFDYQIHHFQTVRYANDYSEIDFFESLGALSRAKLSGFWFIDEGGTPSTTGRRVLLESAEWRDAYWASHSLTTTTKLPEWSHEEEYRLVLSPMLTNYDAIALRKLSYRFSDLAGIAFGLKTSHADKLAIMRVIEKKALTEKRTDFQFYQSAYSPLKKKIELIPLSLLQIRP